MVARFHEGCFHRRVNGQIEEFIFTVASTEAVKSWARQIEKMMASYERPKVARWLIDLRLSGPLQLSDIVTFVTYLQDCPGTIGKELRVAYLTDTPDIFEKLFSGIHSLFDVETHAKWFNSSVRYDQRPSALHWLMQKDTR